MADFLKQLSTALADRYRVEREIGRGGMATVYLVDDLKHRRLVALKVLHPELAATGVVGPLPAFAAAFDCQETDRMVRPPNARLRLW